MINLTRFCGIIAPNSNCCVPVTHAERHKDSRLKAADEAQDKTPAEHHAVMTCAQRLKRMFNIDVAMCRTCGDTAELRI